MGYVLKAIFSHGRGRQILKRLSKYKHVRGWRKMFICKASEIPRNEAYREVRRSEEG
jgi:hypothetical protein